MILLALLLISVGNFNKIHKFKIRKEKVVKAKLVCQ